MNHEKPSIFRSADVDFLTVEKDIALREDGMHRDARLLVERLSSRERQVLELLGVGCSVKSISVALGLNARTVEVYQANTLKKFGVASVAEAVWVAIYAGINRSPD